MWGRWGLLFRECQGRSVSFHQVLSKARVSNFPLLWKSLPPQPPTLIPRALSTSIITVNVFLKRWDLVPSFAAATLIHKVLFTRIIISKSFHQVLGSFPQLFCTTLTNYPSQPPFDASSCNDEGPHTVQNCLSFMPCVHWGWQRLCSL